MHAEERDTAIRCELQRWREWTREEIRRVGYRVVDLIADHLSTLPSEPVFHRAAGTRPAVSLDARAGRRRSRRRHPPRFREPIEPYPFGNGHPALLGLGELAAGGDGCVRRRAGRRDEPELRRRQSRGHLRRAAGAPVVPRHARLPRTSMGLLVSGGSMATMTALAVARHVKSGVDVRADGLRGAPRPFAFYMYLRGARLRAQGDRAAGIRQRRDPDDRDRRRLSHEGRGARRRADAGPRPHVQPIAVVATAGTTNTGAIDDSRRSPTSAGGTTSGCTSTPRTAGRRSSRDDIRRRLAAHRARRQRRPRSAQVDVRASRSRHGARARRRAPCDPRSAWSRPICGPTAAPPASAVCRGSASTASSRRADSAR